MHLLGDELRFLQRRSGTYRDPLRERVHVDDVCPLRAAAHLQAAPLSDREVVVALVRAYNVAVDVGDLPRGLRRLNPGLALDDLRVAVRLRHKADLVRLLLLRHRQPPRLGDGPHLRLGELSEREQRLGQLRLR